MISSSRLEARRLMTRLLAVPIPSCRHSGHSRRLWGFPISQPASPSRGERASNVSDSPCAAWSSRVEIYAFDTGFGQQKSGKTTTSWAFETVLIRWKLCTLSLQAQIQQISCTSNLDLCAETSQQDQQSPPRPEKNAEVPHSANCPHVAFLLLDPLARPGFLQSPQPRFSADRIRLARFSASSQGRPRSPVEFPAPPTTASAAAGGSPAPPPLTRPTQALRPAARQRQRGGGPGRAARRHGEGARLSRRTRPADKISFSVLPG